MRLPWEPASAPTRFAFAGHRMGALPMLLPCVQEFPSLRRGAAVLVGNRGV